MHSLKWTLSRCQKIKPDAPSDRSAASDELTILLADLTQRQLEIIDRGRSENYLYVVFFTAIGAIVAATGAYLSVRTTTFPWFLPLLLAIGFVVFLCLPINLVHLASVTELRRLYVQENLEPRLRELAGNLSKDARPPSAGGVFSFEAFDRDAHHGAFNFVIGVRSGFMSLPAMVLLGFYIFVRIQTWGQRTLPSLIIEGVLLAVGAFAIGVVIWSFVHIWQLIKKTQVPAQPRSTDPV